MTAVDELARGLDQLRDSIARTAHIAPQVARQEVHREGRAYFRGAVVASVIASLLVGVPLVLLANRFSEYVTADELRAAQFEASSQDIRRLAEGAHDLGVAANAELARRGLATVPIPAPGTATDSQVLAAASIAQVAAKIASESIVVPTPAQIRAEVTAQLAKLPPPPVGPNPQQLNEGVQAYLAANAEALRGPRGEPERRARPRRAWPNPPNARAPKGSRASGVSHRWAGQSPSPTDPSPPANAALLSIRLLPGTRVPTPPRRPRPRPRPHSHHPRTTVVSCRYPARDGLHTVVCAHRGRLGR